MKKLKEYRLYYDDSIGLYIADSRGLLYYGAGVTAHDALRELRDEFAERA